MDPPRNFAARKEFPKTPQQIDEFFDEISILTEE